MTVRTRRMPAKPSAAHVRMAAAMHTPLPRNPAPALDLAWRGSLSLGENRYVGGELRNAHGWVLDVRGCVMARDRLALRLFVARVGVLLVQADDLGITADLTEQSAGSWPLLMALEDGDRWTGAVTGLSWRLVVTGTRVSAGRMALAAMVEAVRG